MYLFLSPFQIYNPDHQVANQITAERSTNLSFLPDDVLRIILSLAISDGSLATLGALRLTAPHSERLQSILDGMRTFHIYLNGFLLNEMGEPCSMPPGVICMWSIAKIIRRAGPGSGLVHMLKNLFSKYRKWHYGQITVVVIPGPGWFKIIDYKPCNTGW